MASLLKIFGDTSRGFFERIFPLIDIVESGNKLHVFADMPGFEKQDITVTVSKSLVGIILTIAGRRKTIINAGIIHFQERPLEVKKDLWLPIRIKEIDEAQIRRRFGNGVVQVIIPIKPIGIPINIESTKDNVTPELEPSDESQPVKQEDLESSKESPEEMLERLKREKEEAEREYKQLETEYQTAKKEAKKMKAPTKAKK